MAPKRKWNEQMNLDLLACKAKALTLTSSEDPPRQENGKKKGYMQVMKELWDEMGYAHIQCSSQNLRDQAARVEKTLGNVAETIAESVHDAIETVRNSDIQENVEEIGNDEIIQNANILQELQDVNLHTPTIEPVESLMEEINTISSERCILLDSAKEILSSINSNEGDYANRKVDTRTKEKPSSKDRQDINIVVEELIKQNHLSPEDDPFNYLWMVNLVLYSVVIAFLFIKGWKKQSDQNVNNATKSDKSKRLYEENAQEIRKKISIAKGELTRIRENRKITKKGKRNRKILEKECKSISTAGLIDYMEKQKSRLRKLKKSFYRQKREKEAREINKQFQLDPGRVYEKFDDAISRNKEENKPPKYVNNGKNAQDKSNMFKDIQEASTFWKDLWEKEGKGDRETSWLEEIRTAFNRKVPPPSEENFVLETSKAVKVLSKKKNWSAPGPDRLTNYWWKRTHVLHDGVARSFQAIIQENNDFPWWFTEGKTTLIPKPGDFTSANQRPITCLNTIYKWFTSCLLEPMNDHLNNYGLMEIEQRGAKEGCSGTMNNLLIDRMVTEDCSRGKRNLSMAWVDVAKAYDSVDHGWLEEMMVLHRFPVWMKNVVCKLSKSWNTKIATRTTCGHETSETIRFRNGLPQGDALCPRLFTLCMNPIAWKLKATEGYRLSKPINAKVTDLLYIDDLKIFASSETKLSTVLKSTQAAMKDIGLNWNSKKCSVMHIKRGVQSEDVDSVKLDESFVVKCLKEQNHYKFLGVLENVKQEDKLVLECASKEFLERLSVIWSSPLSDVHRVVASNQYALPVLSYMMWTQRWPISELQRIDREARKIMVENGGKHPAGSSALLYLPRENGGRGLKSVEQEYKVAKIKAAMKVYSTTDCTMEVVRKWEECSMEKGRHSWLKDATKFAQELGLVLELNHPEPVCHTEVGEEISAKKVKNELKKSINRKLQREVSEQKWQGKITSARWNDKNQELNECFAWLKEWRCAPTHTVAGLEELHQQLLPTKIYHQKKTGTNGNEDINCRLCGKVPESMAHVLAGCGALAQTQYLSRHNAALKIVFFELLKDFDLIESNPPWFSPIQPKPHYENNKAIAYWDIQVFAEETEVRANRIDARVEDKENKEILLIEMTCPWIENREKKEEEKTRKYAALRWEIKQRNPGYKVKQINIVMDVLGGYSKDVGRRMTDLFGKIRAKNILRRMQKTVLSSSLNIARRFKIMC